MKKTILIAIGILALLAMVAVALVPSPVPVSTVRVEKGYFAELAEDEGFTRLRFTSVVAAPIGGYLHRVDLEPGDRVQSGDVLFTIEPFPAPALDSRTREQAREHLEAARARVAAARADMEMRRYETDYARTELKRQTLLFDREVIPQATLDRYRNDLDRTLAAKQAAEAVVEAARYEMENARALLAVAAGERHGDEHVLAVRSTAEGLVLRRDRHHEGVVQAGEVILETGSFDDLEVRVDVLSYEAVRIRPGMRVMLEHWGGEGTLDGRVRRVEPSGYTRVSALGVDEQRVPVFVTLDSPRDVREYLGDGYRVEARFVLWEDDQVVQVPLSALFREKNRWHVFVVENGTAHRRTVETGRRSGLMVQIRKGLAPDELVVSHPGDRIRDGTRVKVP